MNRSGNEMQIPSCLKCSRTVLLASIIFMFALLYLTSGSYKEILTSLMATPVCRSLAAGIIPEFRGSSFYKQSFEQLC